MEVSVESDRKHDDHDKNNNDDNDDEDENHDNHDDCHDDHDDEDDDYDYEDENRSRGRRTSRGRVGHAGHTRLAYKVLSPTNSQIQSALANKYTNTKCHDENTQIQSAMTKIHKYKCSCPNTIRNIDRT